MRRALSGVAALLASGLLLSACAAAGAPAAKETTSQTGAAAPQQTGTIIIRAEPPSLASRPLVGFSGSLNPPVYLFNATLAYTDEKEANYPDLVEALPQLNTETWRVFPDGRMETTYHLKAGLTWQDGTPLTPDDFAFAQKVYATPELGRATGMPTSEINEVVAKDSRTVLIRWSQPYPYAGQLSTDFPALPRHLLKKPYESVSAGDAPSFVSDSFWTLNYVGLGPFKVDHWEPGVAIEASAFDGFALGKPKIDRIRLVPIGDPNTALAKMLSGEGDYLVDAILGLDQGKTLEQEWRSTDAGTVFFAPVLIRLTQIQHRPEYAKPKALLDVQVRKALAYAFDVPGALDVMTDGKGVATWTMTSPRADYYPIVERGITKRPYNPRMTLQLLEQAGYTQGADGIYISSGGERLEMELWNTGGTFEQENRIFADGLRKAGIGASDQTLGPALLSDPKQRALISGLFTGGANVIDQRLEQHSPDDIPRPENHWQGNNRGGWDSQEYGRLWDAYNRTLDRNERVQQIAQMEHLINEDVGTIPHYLSVIVTAHSAKLEGVAARMTPDAAGDLSTLGLGMESVGGARLIGAIRSRGRDPTSPFSIQTGLN